MADKQAKLLAALKKRPSEDAPPPLAPAEPGASDAPGTLKLRKSNLLGVVTWEQALEQLALNGQHDYTTCVETLTKMLNNVVANPSEAKYRKIRYGNPNFAAKVYGCKGAPELLQLAGFKETIEAGFLVLPEAADLKALQQAIDTLSAHAVARQEKEEKKRKADSEAAARARAERAQRAREAAAPSEYDAAVAGASQQQAMMADEDEAMIEAIEAHFDAHPELKQGRALDAYDIERQVAGPGSTVVASVAASAGTAYYDYLATMKRGEDGAWAVSKIVPADGQ